MRLDRSAFHPGGGGQVSDVGSLEHAGGLVDVVGIETVDGDVWHVLADDGAELSGPVVVRVDAEHRSRVAQLHTDSHVLNALVFERFPGTLVTGAQINADGTGRMDFDLSEVDNDVLRGLDAGVNDVIGRGVDVRSVYVDAGDAATTAGLVRSLSVAPPPTPDGRLRIIDIDGVDRQACGGTHLSNTAPVPAVPHHQGRVQGQAQPPHPLRARVTRCRRRRGSRRSRAPGTVTARFSARVTVGGARAGRPGTRAPITHVSSAIAAWTSPAASAAQTTTMPTPMLSVRWSSTASMPVASSRDQAEQRRDRPRPEAHLGVDAVGQHPGQVLDEPAAGDVGEGLDAPGGQRRAQHVEVAAVRLEQRLAERAVHPGRRDVHRDPLEDLAQQRVAVGVRAVGGDADEHVAGGDVGAGEQLGPLGDADQRAGDVEGAGRVDAGHLGRLAAEQRAARRPRRPRPCR